VAVDPAGETLAATSGAVVPPAALHAGANVGRYRLVRELGTGGMGVVWAAHDPDLDRDVALKVMRGDDDAGTVARLLREARAMAKLKHPNVLTVYEVGTAGDRAYIAMELVDGDNLAQWLARRQPRRDVIAALRAAGRGLAAAHAAGIIHRDFKPHNVLRGRDGRVLVTDFGLARTAGELLPIAAPIAMPAPAPEPAAATALDETLDATPRPHAASSSSSDALTRTGALVGTPAYMSPEQFAGGAPDPRTDQFAFCVTAWQALGGARPFEGDSVEELASAVKKGVLSAPAALPRRVRAVLARGLDPDPANRFRDLDELLAAFDRATRSRARFAIAGAAIAIVAVGGVAVFFATRSGGSSAFAECDDLEATFGDAWNSARGSRLAARDIVDTFNIVHRDWHAKMHQTCDDPAGATPENRAKLDCLLDVRDRFAAETTMFEKLPAASLHPFDPMAMPHSSACNGKRATPRPPAELANDIQQLRVGVARFRHLARDETAAHKLIDRAKRIGWAPLTVEIDLLAARRAQNAGDAAAARADFRDAETIAGAANLRDGVVAARLGLAELALRALDDPRDADEASRAIDAVAAAATKDDEDAPKDIEAMRAWLAAARGDFDAAIPKLDVARRYFHFDHFDARRLARIARQHADAVVRRDRGNDLEAAERILRSALARLDEQRRGDDARALVGPLAALLWRRGDLVALHDLDRHAHAGPTPHGEKRHGRVVDERGAPVARAAVVAWHGELVGDRERAYSEARFLPRDAFATTDDHGEFSIVVPGGNAGIVAELGAARSVPQLVPAGDAALELVVKPTQRLADTTDVRDKPSRLSIGARFELAPDVAWIARGALDDRGGFELDRVPRGASALWLDGDVGVLDMTAKRRAAFEHGRPAWRGRSFDVIVRGARATQLHVWLWRGRVDPPTTIAALRGELARSGDYVEVIARSIGAVDATAFARASYERGDLHAAFFGPADDAVTACASQAVVDPAPHIWCASTTSTGDAVVVIDAK
jgi:predicted Ser/Thr protein kinase